MTKGIIKWGMWCVAAYSVLRIKDNDWEKERLENTDRYVPLQLLRFKVNHFKEQEKKSLWSPPPVSSLHLLFFLFLCVCERKEDSFNCVL